MSGVCEGCVRGQGCVRGVSGVPFTYRGRGV